MSYKYFVQGGIYGTDLEGQCTFCNPAALNILGYKRSEELLGQNVHHLIHHTHRDGTPYPRACTCDDDMTGHIGGHRSPDGRKLREVSTARHLLRTTPARTGRGRPIGDVPRRPGPTGHAGRSAQATAPVIWGGRHRPDRGFGRAAGRPIYWEVITLLIVKIGSRSAKATPPMINPITTIISGSI